MSMKTTTRERPCRYCHKSGRCKYHDDSEHAICFRPDEVADVSVGTLKRDRNGGSYLIISPGRKKGRGQHTQHAAPAKPERPSDDQCDQLYRYLLDLRPFELNEFWRADLRKRGLTDVQIDAGSFRRMPNQGEQADSKRKLLEQFPDAEAVPGIARLGLYKCGSLVIPIRNRMGRIIALKLRLAAPVDGQKYQYFSGGSGPSSGSPCHVPPGTAVHSTTHRRADAVRICEGELKAYVCSELTKIRSISFPGCSQWAVCIPVLGSLNAKVVRVAFDSDCRTNPSVASSQLACIQGLQSAGFTAQIELWDPDLGKGLDDVLAAGHASRIKVLNAEQSLAWATQCVEQTRPPEVPSCEPSEPSCDATKEVATGKIFMRADNPPRLAKAFLAQRTERKLVCWRETFYEFREHCFREIANSILENELHEFIHAEFVREAEEKLARMKSSKQASVDVRNITLNHVRATFAALRAVVSVGDVEPPCWLAGEPTFRQDDILATKSGLIDLADLQGGLRVIPPTDRLFNLVAVPHAIDMNATCPAWIDFLNSVWGDDPESIRSLAQWFGYVLTSGVGLHKVLVLVGPPRSGKSTIVNTLKSLIGPGNSCSPMIADLDGFKLSALLGKRLACVPEIRSQNRAEAAKALARLLAITGQDGQLIDRKNKSPIADAVLPIKFLFATNVLPTFDDSSSALLSRVVMLETRQSFVGREDRTLPKRLESELPGILQWSLRGLIDLQQSGDILQPESCLQSLEEWAETNCPVRQFVAERCERGPECHVLCSELHRAFQDWASMSGRFELSNTLFAQRLRAACPGVGQVRRASLGRPRAWKGIGLRPEAVSSTWPEPDIIPQPSVWGSPDYPSRRVGR